MAFSAKDGHGLDAWLAWLGKEIEHFKALLLKQQTLLPRVQQEGAAVHAQAGGAKFYPLTINQ
jgi:hypothetical protein